MTHIPDAAVPPPQTRLHDYIDALRGYAVLLVITSHVGHAYPELPWRLKTLTNFGWHGVQLFFVVSCLTLILSWRQREGREHRRVTQFLIRRVFRIAPMFWLAAAFYLVVRPPTAPIPWEQVLATLGFAHGWSPALIPTVPGVRDLVPGSWSIAAEFGFYLVFPLLAVRIVSLGRSLAFLALALLASWPLTQAALAWYAPTYGAEAAGQFAYYWLPNQLAVFAVGFVAYYLIRALNSGAEGREAAGRLRRHGNVLVAAVAVGIVLLANLSIPRLVSPEFPFLPRHVLAALLFAALVVVLAVSPGHWLVNRAAIWLGRVSFSAYLLHFAVYPFLADLLPGVFDTSATGVAAIGRFALLWVATVAATFAVCWITYSVVEQPMIGLGRRLCARVQAAGAAGRSTQPQMADSAK